MIKKNERDDFDIVMEFTHLECEMPTPRGMNRANGMRQVKRSW